MAILNKYWDIIEFICNLSNYIMFGNSFRIYNQMITSIIADLIQYYRICTQIVKNATINISNKNLNQLK